MEAAGQSRIIQQKCSRTSSDKRVAGGTFSAVAAEVPQTSVHQSRTMCAGERSYTDRRKAVVAQALNHLGIKCPQQDLVPRVALLASGGGERSALALLGSLYQMEKDAWLDSLLYFAGVSGATWTMAAVYSDPMWSTDMNRTLARLLDSRVDIQEVTSWLSERSAAEFFSLSDIWGAMTSAALMKQMTVRNISEEATRNVTNPYPVYCGMENNCFVNGPTEGKWFEVTPHQAGFPDLGFFVETSLLGSRFQNGVLVERKPEMDMIQLQGILGSVLADMDTVKEKLPAWLNVSWEEESIMEEHLHVFRAVHKLIPSLLELVHDEDTDLHLRQLDKLLADRQDRDLELVRRKTLTERQTYFDRWCQDLLSTTGAWSQSLPDGAAKHSVNLLVRKIIPLILKWEWGTTLNFLHQLPEPTVPECLHSRERINLVDGGLHVNVGYPSFLGEKRDVDVMIVPESSAGDMFETLTLGREHAAQVNKPFPVIDPQILEEKDWPKDCYVFEGKDKEPTIIYMPLFNRKNCKDAEEVKSRMQEFSTFQPPLSHEKRSFLIEVGKTNMKNNKEVILREIRKAAERRLIRSNRQSTGGNQECGVRCLV
ncbi:cytosolic phospholipase A2 gamma-like isoform X1 [Synchiropus splendidus]|uniref:cytosolic phospholipase A2 gamma-like isoform X1 n=2 Tax=Synchiropus splendidus TaxID=270530 RepID=UPI00237D58EA|nr:cytosolic phospholipase A2 gamma-like isoform X1 [Synchiropus splendidus]